uniref:Brix domain-containing protein n=1 Tax=Plectus sambesii TaxID=2011161 RepID=A0A914XC57_9BILA
MQAARAEKRAERAEEKREDRKLHEGAHANAVAEELDKAPHSFIIQRGKVGKYALRLVQDIRKIMEPYTASRLKVMKRNNLKDFVINAAPFGVTHLMVLTRSENSLTLRIIRNPQGPTLTFKIKEYTLAKHVLSALRRPVTFQQQFNTQPLVVMNNFNDKNKKQLQLVQTMFQNMFPSINVDTLNLARVRRCVMINYDDETDTIDIRHYTIKTVPSGLSKSTKKLVQSKVPDLSKYNDISDYFLNPGQLSESEYEMDQKEVKLSQDLTTRGCKKGQKTNIRLIELGPRLTLQLVKIEEGIDEGEVLYHSYIKKSTKELIKQRKELSTRRKTKERRRKEEEHRIIRRLKAAADREKEEEE